MITEETITLSEFEWPSLEEFSLSYILKNSIGFARGTGKSAMVQLFMEQYMTNYGETIFESLENDR